MSRKLQERGRAVYKSTKGTRPIYSMFRTRQNKRYLSGNRAYSMCYISLSNVAAFLNITSSEANKLLQGHKVFPKLYRERVPMYLVKQVSELAKKLKMPFIIPVGYFDEPRTVYLGKEFSVLDKIWTNGKIWRFDSLLEMYAQIGLPVQNIFIAPSIIPKLETEFMHEVGRAINNYNKVHKKEDQKRIMLCSNIDDRKTAQEWVDKYSKWYPGVVCTIDIDHLIYLRKLAHRNYVKSHV